MCSPVIYLDELKVKETEKFQNIILNNVEEIFKDEICNRKLKFTKTKETEYKYVFFGVYRGMQTYCAEMPGTEFKKIGPNCRDLAVAMDRHLTFKLKADPVNGFVTKV